MQQETLDDLARQSISRLTVASGARSAGQQSGTGILPVDARQGSWAGRPCHLLHRQSADAPLARGSRNQEDPMWLFTTDGPARRSRNQTQSILQEATEETEIDPEERGGGHSVNGWLSARRDQHVCFCWRALRRQRHWNHKDTEAQRTISSFRFSGFRSQISSICLPPTLSVASCKGGFGFSQEGAEGAEIGGGVSQKKTKPQRCSPASSSRNHAPR